ncbi:hyaluronidase-1 [Suncus etruscus]|uniref:hyaluronidase-1 n=1 Tax=Suncus etruscus TaxID=109475 RepID=UPI002110C840|nr:hyaluronidase-1 [Suncus etruscus]
MAAHLLLICTLFLTLSGDTVTSSRDTVVPKQPFSIIWNGDTQGCLKNYSVNVDISFFDVLVNPGQTFRGPDMTIFYRDQLGTYPYYTSTGQPVFGGLPQNASLDTHLAHAFRDILAAIPASTFSGLAVIDWESWRPRWAFNFDSKNIYRECSKDMVQKEHPHWPPTEVEEAARNQFQEAAKAWMRDTLELGQGLRPNGIWGFYQFPQCFNYDIPSPNYTGQCPSFNCKENDKLDWLWKQSNALYPSIYLPASLKGTKKTQMFVRHRVGEAFRVALSSGNPNLLVLPYLQVLYVGTNDFLPLEELEHSLGESAAQGAAGVVLWMSSKDSRTKESCAAIKKYVDSTLGPFILNVTSGAHLCSEALCSGHGRCVRRPSHPDALLILNPASFSIYHPENEPNTLKVKGTFSPEDLKQMAAEFECRCYPEWSGTECAQQGTL